MIDKTKRLEKEQAKAKTKKRIYVEVDPENYDYFPETRQADYYDNDVPQRVAIYVRVSTDDVRQTHPLSCKRSIMKTSLSSTLTGRSLKSTLMRVSPALL